MKIAVLSDIHGNYPALQAVTADIDVWQPDQVIVNGDMVNRGPCSHTVLDYVLRRQEEDGWHLLRGNHESYLLELNTLAIQPDDPSFEINRFAYWTYRQLKGSISRLENLPERFVYCAPDGSELRIVHASMQSDRDGLYMEQSDEEMARRINPAPAVFVTSHTHQPFIRRIDRSLVVNVGSVGSPFDLDWRPSYGRLTWHPELGWRASIRRVVYDRGKIEADYARSGFLDEAGPLAQIMLVELRRARGLIFRWADRYEDAIMNGAISVEESVQRILMDEDVRPYLGPPGWTP